MLDFTIINAAPIGFFVFGILATLLVAISKAALAARWGHCHCHSCFWFFPRVGSVGLTADFSALRFLCRLEILSPCGAPHCHHHDFGRLFGAGFGLAAL